MISPLGERPAGLLTRHFFHALFDFGVFSQEGADSFVRVIIGLFSLIISLGFLLVRIYAQKYGMLFAAATGEPYARAMLADTALAIALSMWIVAFVTVLVSHSLFPDETDFRVLMPLPIGRGLVFGAKLLGGNHRHGGGCIGDVGNDAAAGDNDDFRWRGTCILDAEDFGSGRGRRGAAQHDG